MEFCEMELNMVNRPVCYTVETSNVLNWRFYVLNPCIG